MKDIESKEEFIPYGKQWITEDDINEVVRVLRSDWLTQGPNISAFEDAICEITSAKYAVVVSSGTAALHIACLAAGVQDGDEIITTPNTFVATVNCITYNRGTPILVDIDNDTYNISPLKIEEYIQQHPNPSKIKGIIPVHFAGHPCPMEELQEIAEKYNLFILEDACHALGAKWKNSEGNWVVVGSCYNSLMSVFSFHPVKHVTMGEGGLVTTNNEDIYKKLLMLRNHGITKDESILVDNEGPWYYEMHHLGFNYRISDIQTALGLSQLKRLDFFTKRRREMANKYNQAFNEIEFLKIPVEREGCLNAYHLYVLLVDFQKIGKTRVDVINRLKQQGIGTQVHYIPVFKQPYYKEYWNTSGDQFENTKKYYEQCLSIPLYPSMTDDQVDKVIQCIRQLT